MSEPNENIDTDKALKFLKKIREVEAAEAAAEATHQGEHVQAHAVSKRDERLTQFLYVVIAVLGTWFVSSNWAFKDVPSQGEIRELKEFIEERDAKQEATLEKIQSQNQAAILKITDEQQRSAKELSANLSSLRDEFLKLQADLAAKEKYGQK